MEEENEPEASVLGVKEPEDHGAREGVKRNDEEGPDEKSALQTAETDGILAPRAGQEVSGVKREENETEWHPSRMETRRWS